MQCFNFLNSKLSNVLDKM